MATNAYTPPRPTRHMSNSHQRGVGQRVQQSKRQVLIGTPVSFHTATGAQENKTGKAA